MIGGDNEGEGNLILGNLRGMGVDNSSYNTISGNYVGTNADATAAVGNGSGIWGITNPNYVVPGFDPLSHQNTIAGNVISGNSGYALILRGSQKKVLRNFIGINGAGSEALANGSGIVVDYGTQNITTSCETGQVVKCKIKTLLLAVCQAAQANPKAALSNRESLQRLTAVKFSWP